MPLTHDDDDDGDRFARLWPRAAEGAGVGGVGAPEQFLVFAARIANLTMRAPLRLSSSLAYELWIDGAFVGDGGHRCNAGSAALDEWRALSAVAGGGGGAGGADSDDAGAVVVRVHWIDPTRTPLYSRAAHADAFLAIERADADAWSCHVDESVRTTSTKCCLQLPRQNIARAPPRAGRKLALAPAPLARPWRAVDFGIARADVVAVVPRLLDVHEGHAGAPLTEPIRSLLSRAERAGDDAGAGGSGTGSSGRDDDDLARDAVAWSRPKALPAGVTCATYDLGAIALHRVEVDTQSSPALLCWSELPDFQDTWASAHRADVKLVDAVVAHAQRAAPFGWRGGRYVHVLYETGQGRAPLLRAWRRRYPLRWRRDIQPVDTRDQAIVDACRANLVAVVDGGVVDTCWRERAQWTGDLRMSAVALRELCERHEPGDADDVVTLALTQLAQSYDESFAMVPAVAPASPPRPCMIPGYHAAFCLAVAEHRAHLAASERGRIGLAVDVAHRSLAEWKRRYLRAGLLAGFPASCWWFTDWDPTRRAPAGSADFVDDPSRTQGPDADAVTHAWFDEACRAFDDTGATRVDSDGAVDVGAFDARFWSPDDGAYRLHPRGPASPQATAAAALAFASHREESIDWLLACHARRELAQRVTPYFLTFVARAVALRDREAARQIIREIVGPRVARFGTVPEKVNDDYSLAHGWSVGFVDLLLR